MCPSVPPPPVGRKKEPRPPGVCMRCPPMPCVRVRVSVRACIFKGAKGASVAGCQCVRVPVRVCVGVRVCICAGVACVRDGVRADGAGVRCVSVRVGVIVPCVLCVRV